MDIDELHHLFAACSQIWDMWSFYLVLKSFDLHLQEILLQT